MTTHPPSSGSEPPKSDGELGVYASLTARAAGARIAFLALLDGDVLRFVAWHGAELSVSRLEILCREALLEPGVFAVSDLRNHPRWSRHSLVVGDNGLRFFAGVVLRAGDGEPPIGLLGAFAQRPRELGKEHRESLEEVGRVVLKKLQETPERADEPSPPPETRSSAADDAVSYDSDQIHSREHYRSVVKVMAEGILLRAADGRILTCNTSAERILGVSRKEITGMKKWPANRPILHEDGSPLPVENFPTLITLRTGEPCSEVIVGIDKGAAGITWISVNTQPLKKPENDRPHAVVASFNDITHLRQTQNALQEALRRTEEFRTLFEIANAMFCITGFDGYFKQLNPAWERFLGHPVEELLERRVEELIHPDDRELTRREAGRLTSGANETIAFENRFLHRDGTYRWLSWNATADPPNERVYAVASDVTEKRRAQAEREALIRKLEEKNTELERYTYTVSHDLKSPLLTIRGFLGYIEKNAVEGNIERLKDDLERVDVATHRMQQLLDELLELSRVGRIVKPPRKISLTDLARDAASLVPKEIGDRTVEIDIPDDLPVVLCDQTRLLQVFQNLFGNAVKFMGDQAQPRIEVRAEKRHDEIVCQVRDNGVGIDPRYLGRVFNLFEQIDPQAGGTGIGLALVQRIIEIHGGRVWVESKGLGEGASFHLTFPDNPPLTGERKSSTSAV